MVSSYAQDSIVVYKHVHIVCRLQRSCSKPLACAILQGIQMKSRGPKFDGVLRALIVKLERDKPAAGLGDGDKEYCRSFAESIFARADKIDRAGRADKSTCLTFYAATIFIEVGLHTASIHPVPLLADVAELSNTTKHYKACTLVLCRF